MRKVAVAVMVVERVKMCMPLLLLVESMSLRIVSLPFRCISNAVGAVVDDWNPRSNAFRWSKGALADSRSLKPLRKFKHETVSCCPKWLPRALHRHRSICFSMLSSSANLIVKESSNTHPASQVCSEGPRPYPRRQHPREIRRSWCGRQRRNPQLMPQQWMPSVERRNPGRDPVRELSPALRVAAHGGGEGGGAGGRRPRALPCVGGAAAVREDSGDARPRRYWWGRR